MAGTTAYAFWDRVDVSDNADACWPWTGARLPVGYGKVRWGPRQNSPASTHRVAFYLANGFMPRVVRHSCDNPPCCNPRHLIAGTQADNMLDMVHRRRTTSPVSAAHMVLILSEPWLPASELSKIVGICSRSINRIRRREATR